MDIPTLRAGLAAAIPTATAFIQQAAPVAAFVVQAADATLALIQREGAEGVATTVATALIEAGQRADAELREEQEATPQPGFDAAGNIDIAAFVSTPAARDALRQAARDAARSARNPRPKGR